MPASRMKKPRAASSPKVGISIPVALSGLFGMKPKGRPRNGIFTSSITM